MGSHSGSPQFTKRTSPAPCHRVTVLPQRPPGISLLLLIAMKPSERIVRASWRPLPDVLATGRQGSGLSRRLKTAPHCNSRRIRARWPTRMSPRYEP